MQFIHRKIQFLREFLIGCRTSEFSLKTRDRLFILFDVLAHADRDPVLCAQMIEHGSADTHPRIGFKFIAAIGLVTLDRIQQTEKTAAQEILPIDMLWQTDGNASCNKANQGKIMLGNTVAHIDGLFRCVGTPQILNILGGLLCHLQHLLSAVCASYAGAGPASPFSCASAGGVLI